MCTLSLKKVRRRGGDALADNQEMKQARGDFLNFINSRKKSAGQLIKLSCIGAVKNYTLNKSLVAVVGWRLLLGSTWR